MRDTSTRTTVELTPDQLRAMGLPVYIKAADGAPAPAPRPTLSKRIKPSKKANLVLVSP